MIRRSTNSFLALFYDIAMSKRQKELVSGVYVHDCANASLSLFSLRFEIAIFIMIFLNMVVMGVEHYGQPPVFTFILELCNALFTTMFALGSSSYVINY